MILSYEWLTTATLNPADGFVTVQCATIMYRQKGRQFGMMQLYTDWGGGGGQHMFLKTVLTVHTICVSNQGEKVIT